MCLSPDSRILTIGYYDGTLILKDPIADKRKYVEEGHKTRI